MSTTPVPTLDPYLRLLSERGGSDLFFTIGAPPQVKI